MTPHRLSPAQAASAALVLVAVLAMPAAANAQSSPVRAMAAPAAAPSALKLAPGLPASAILARPDSDLVEMPDGRRIRVGDIRELSGMAQKMQVAPNSMRPPALAVKPTAAGTRVSNPAELAAALKRPDGDTVVLPSGRRVTVGQLRFVQPYVEKKTGRPLATPASARPSLAGPAIRVTQQSDFKDLLQRPDGTVLEAPDGTRITVGELKASLAAGDAATPNR
jgi:hypothetical protein